MNIDPAVFGLVGLAMLASVFFGGLLGLHLKNRVPTPGLRDRLRAMIYLTQYDAALEYQGLRRREVRAKVNELRADLSESAADGGVVAALDRLGPPRVLASEMAGTRMVPSWARGTLWLAVTLAIGLFALALSISAFLAAVESSAAPGSTANWSNFFLTMTATSTNDGPPTLAIEIPFLPLLLLLLPFAWGARIWRLWSGKRTAPIHDLGH